MVAGKTKLEFGKDTMLMTGFVDVDDDCTNTYALAIKKVEFHSVGKNIQLNQNDWCADVLMTFKDVDALDDLISQLNELKDIMTKQ